jgi:uncharacterized protein (DUF58 family)
MSGLANFPDFSEAFLGRLALLRFKPKPGIAGRGAGEHLVRKGGASVEFADFRTYTWGDDFRLIDWNSYARLDRPFVKVYRDEEGITIHFLLDCSNSMDWGSPNKLAYSLRLIAALGFIACSGYNWVKFQSLPDGYSYPEKRGRYQIPSFFDFLSGIRSQGQCHLNREISRYAELNPRPSLIFLISDALDPLGVEGGIKRLLARGHQVIFMHILAPEEFQLEYGGDLELEDREWGTKVEVTLEEQTVKVFQETFERWRASLRSFCLAHQIPYLFVPSSLSCEELILKRFPMAGILR